MAGIWEKAQPRDTTARAYQGARMVALRVSPFTQHAEIYAEIHLGKSGEDSETTTKPSQLVAVF